MMLFSFFRNVLWYKGYLFINKTIQISFLVPNAVVEDETMSRTVHGLQSELLLLHLKPEHVFGVHVPMARGLPQP